MAYLRTDSELSRSRMIEVRNLLKEADSLQSSLRIERLLLQYDAIKIIEAMDLTVAQKAQASGISFRNYQYARRVVRDFSNRIEFGEYLDKEAKVKSITHYKAKPKPSKADLMVSLKSWLRKKGINFNDDIFKELLRGINLQVSYVNPINTDEYFKYRPCICCGELPFHEAFELREYQKGVMIPMCPTCIKDNKRPDSSMVINMLSLYSEDLYKSYKELLGLI